MLGHHRLHGRTTAVTESIIHTLDRSSSRMPRHLGRVANEVLEGMRPQISLNRMTSELAFRARHQVKVSVKNMADLRNMCAPCENEKI